MDAQIVTAASWITSGWIDVAMIAGWMAFVALVGRRVWKRGEATAAPGTGVSPAAADARAKRKRRAR